MPKYVWLASFGARHWDALAIAATREDARAKLIAEVMTSYPDCTFTDEDWDESMCINRVPFPYAEVS